METWETGDQKVRNTGDNGGNRSETERRKEGARHKGSMGDKGDKKSRKWSKMELRRQVRQEVQ